MYADWRGTIVEGVARSVNPPSVLCGMAPFDEPPDPDHRLLEPLVGGRIARANVLRARHAEGAAGDHGDVLLLQEARRERVRVQAGGRDARERIEGAARLERLEPQRIEAVDEQPPTSGVLPPPPLDVGPPTAEG